MSNKERKQYIINKIGSNIFRWNKMIRENALTKLDDKKWTKYIDKILFKKLCDSKGIKTFKTIAIYNQEDWKNIIKDIDLFPEKFIIKSNKSSGRNFIVNNNKEKIEIKNGINKRIRRIKGWGKPHLPKDKIHIEPQYEYIIPKIFIEELIVPIPEDIKIFFVNKKPVLIQIDIDRFGKHLKNLYTIKCEIVPINIVTSDIYNGKTILDEIIENNQFDEMIEIAKKLAEEIELNIFRVDLYYINKLFYGGEITLTPNGGNLRLSYYED